MNHLEIAINHLEITINHLEITVNHLEIAINHLEITINHLEISVNHLEITINHHNSPLNHHEIPGAAERDAHRRQPRGFLRPALRWALRYLGRCQVWGRQPWRPGAGAKGCQGMRHEQGGEA
jgi:hypothetical protein